jgi:hypothetical protein
MGYESRFIIVEKSSTNFSKLNLRWAETLCVLEMSCLGDIPVSFKDTDCFFYYPGDGNKKITEDDYNAKIKEASISDVLTWCEKEYKKSGYRRLLWAINMLKTFKKEKNEDIVVLHYGY